MNCPRDGHAMEVVTATGGGATHLCPECKGMWLPSGRFLRLPSFRDSPGNPTDIACPGCCTAALVARHFRGVEIDLCPACRGVWLDRGELEEILKLARKPSGDDPGGNTLWDSIDTLDFLLQVARWTREGTRHSAGAGGGASTPTGSGGAIEAGGDVIDGIVGFVSGLFDGV